MGSPQLFLSHSSKDSNIVNAFVDFMFKIGLNNKQIFCSSSPYTKIAIKTNIYEHLNKLLSNDSVYVIYFLSDNYYMSPVCLNEMGATWLKKTESLNVLLPDFDFSDIRGVVDKDKVGIKLQLNDDMTRASFNEFKKDLIKMFNIEISDTQWELARDEFLRVAVHKSKMLNMKFSKSYCIGCSNNNGCKIVRKESSEEQITARINFEITDSDLHSIVIFTEMKDFSYYYANNKKLCFEAFAEEGISLVDIEFHFDEVEMSREEFLTDDEKSFKIPLEQFCGVLSPWRAVKQISFVFKRNNVTKPGTVVIKNLRIE